MKYFESLPCSVYWFSGCGNSLVVALEIQEFLNSSGCPTTLHPIENTVPENVDTSGILGIVVPVSAQGTTPLVWDFIRSLPRTANTPCFFVDTLGYYSGGIKGPVKNILKSKGYQPLAAAEIRMPNVFQKKKADADTDYSQIERGKTQVRQFCTDLVQGRGKWSDIIGYSWLMSLFSRSQRIFSLYGKMFPVVIHADTCKKCGLCVRLCPTGHLEMKAKNTVPVQGYSCILCQRCFAYCPSHAITIGSKQTVAYHALPLKELQQHLKK